MERASGALSGLAYGDALGAPTEFMTVAEIEHRYGPGGPRDLEGDPALVTDDTQMTLAVARALVGGLDGIADALRDHFVRWWESPDNNRAPGMTCLQACERLAAGLPWREARGWDECAAALDVLAAAAPDRDADPCLAAGAGWVAEEAPATALHCFLLFRDDPVAALSRAATTSGDSDSIACLTGAFAGATHGFDAWPAEWAERIEHGAEPAALGRGWDR
ncbi:ADP-ribosylglycohydrolase family protein [Actinosynnema sp. NPDC091369]